MLILKVDYLVPLIIQMSYLLVPKIEICLKYFLDKSSQKQPCWVDSFDFSPYHIFGQILSKVVFFKITFWTKNPPKQPLWDRTGVIKGRKFFYVIDAFPMTIVIFQ